MSTNQIRHILTQRAQIFELEYSHTHTVTVLGALHFHIHTRNERETLNLDNCHFKCSYRPPIEDWCKLIHAYITTSRDLIIFIVMSCESSVL